MKNILITACALMICCTVSAQVTRNARPDTTKSNRVVATAQTNTIRAIKKLKRGTALDSRQVVPIMGIDSDSTTYTDDPKLINMIGQIGKNNMPVNVTFTPTKSCINESNCITCNDAVVNIKKNINCWIFEKDQYRTFSEVMCIAMRFQPNKDYLVIMDIDVQKKPEDFKFLIQGWKLSGFGGEYHPILVPKGKSLLTFVIHTNADYKFNTSDNELGSLFVIRPKFDNDPGYRYRVFVYSIKVKELN